MSADKQNANAPQESFEELLAKLEDIVGQLEAGAKPLEESLALYEQGVEALKRCHLILDRAEKRIRLLVKGADGNNKPVIIYVSSRDVVHSFKVIALRLTQDAIPGMRIPIWFRPIQEGR